MQTDGVAPEGRQARMVEWLLKDHCATTQGKEEMVWVGTSQKRWSANRTPEFSLWLQCCHPGKSTTHSVRCSKPKAGCIGTESSPPRQPVCAAPQQLRSHPKLPCLVPLPSGSWGRIRRATLRTPMGQNKDSSGGRAKLGVPEEQNKGFMHCFPASQVFPGKARLCHTSWFLGKTNVTTTNVPPCCPFPHSFQC